MLVPGSRLGSYELVQLVAQGGMADIYLARHTTGYGIERHVALKVLNASRADDPEARALFVDEARVLALLHHENIGRVLDVACVDGVHCLAMEYVHGADLREILACARAARTCVPYDVAVAIVAAAAAGLHHAHVRCDREGRPLHLVHRDVSLSNVMVGHDGVVKVVDFGIARATVSSHRSLPGIVRGKASYMSPEQCLGERVDCRTDVFALGIVLYELTTGRRCFTGASDFDRMLAIVRGRYVPPDEHVADYPRALAAIIARALASDPAARYASAGELVEALERLAARAGWAPGSRPISRFMRELFGDIPEPWLFARWLDAEPTVITARPRRLARGTESEATTATHATAID